MSLRAQRGNPLTNMHFNTWIASLCSQWRYIMKKQIFIISIFLFSLLFTSCLADYLNEKLDYHVPIILSYESVQATEPKTIKIPSETPLTAENLPELSEPGWTFAGWYTDTTFTTKVQEGAVFTQNTTLYAKWVPATDTPFTINNYFFYIHY